MIRRWWVVGLWLFVIGLWQFGQKLLFALYSVCDACAHSWALFEMIRITANLWTFSVWAIIVGGIYDSLIKMRWEWK